MSEVEDSIMALGMQVLLELANDEVFVRWVTEAEIERQIEAGILIPAERLLLGSVKIVPIELVEEESETVNEEEDPEPEPQQDRLDPNGGPFECSVCGEDKVQFKEAQLQKILRNPIVCPDCKDKK